MQDLRREAKTCVSISLSCNQALLAPCSRRSLRWSLWPQVGGREEGGVPSGRARKRLIQVEKDGSGGSSRVSSKGRKMVWSRGWRINTVRCL